MPKKKEILIFIDWFLPGYKAGGPIQSVVNLINHLGHDYDFDVVTSNKDLGEDLPYQNVTINEWIERENCRVIYLDRENQNLKRYRKLFRDKDYNFVYFNSLFSIDFTLKPLLVASKFPIKIILAPRGMLGAGALNIKPLKKKIFLKLFRSLGYSRKINWHATAASEATEIKQHFGEESKVHIATNLSAVMAEHLPEKKKVEGFLNLFFLSRISKKKNLKAALQFLNQIDKKLNINFSIIGPIEDQKYWQECLEIIDGLPENIRIKNIGAVPNHQLKLELKDQHFMLLPTFHENFGHVIMESWQNACPVIISKYTPWEQLEQKKIGFNIPLEQEEQFIKAIEKVTAMDQAEYSDWSKAAFEFAKAYCNDPKAIEASRRLFEG